ncbi:hypothetical protein FUA26_04410 [Seonamhaeicola algicola]|uniref:PorT family protein n=1 Tax=Seonamhaeicola algicola TaxID=1719036 RepID=A0A5C7B5B2_9FLAO|nr:hypothetical protein [Seonamhaeicola algicola]TXE13042.1 hypothetical protein FUA26_04410 [Seonamhaeicola algicola]
MSDKKHIDRLFQERFKDFEAAPSDAVWKHIEANLNKKKKKRIIPIWWRYAGAAALLLLLLTIGFLTNSNKNETPIKVVDTEKTNNNSNTPKTKTPATNTPNTSIANTNDENAVDKMQPSNNTLKNNYNSNKNTRTKNNITSTKSSVSKKGNLTKNKQVIANNTTPQTTKNNTHVASSNVVEENKTKTLQNNTSKTSNINNKNIAKAKKSSEENNTKLIVENTSENKKETLTIEEALEKNKELLTKENNKKRWQVAANAAPVYFNTLGEGSSIDPQFTNNAKSGEINMSYGITASYAFNDKIKIRSGINKVNLGYNTNDVVLFQTAGISAQSSFANVSSNNNSNRDSDVANVASSSVSIISQTTLKSVPESFIASETTLNQSLGYIEVPLEIQYALINKKFGVNVIGGFSSFFLNDNSMYSESNTGQRILLGEATNLNKISYSANFGLGLNYKFSETFDLNLEPMFKYQINTFNNTSGNFTPFIIGVYTGFAIKF